MYVISLHCKDINVRCIVHLLYLYFQQVFNLDSLTSKGPQGPKQEFLILDRLAKLESRPDSCETLQNCVLSRVLANKIIFIKNT